MNSTIRLATLDDALDMAEVIVRSWEVAYKDIMSADYIREKNSTRIALYERTMSTENTNTYVIQYNGNTIGIMKIASPQDEDLGDDAYELHYIYLHPDYFRMGIGTEAMIFAFDKARSLGKLVMSVWVLADNTNSIRFYEKCGFVADGKTAISDRGKPLESIRMKKIL